MNLISEVTRRDLLERLVSQPRPFYGRLTLLDFLERVFDLAALPSSNHRFGNARDDIVQHRIRNEDWDDAELLVFHLPLLSCDDDLFGTFLENCVHPLVLSDSAEARELAARFEYLLKNDGFWMKEVGELSGHPLFKLQRLGTAGSLPYEVALSFAAEQRTYVEEVAKSLRAADVRLFYDSYKEVELWGKDLGEHFDQVFRRDSRFCLMFISAAYAGKAWPTHERRSALARAVLEKQEYILPVRFDETELPGLRPTIGYLDGNRKSPDEIAQLTLEKLRRSRGAARTP